MRENVGSIKIHITDQEGSLLSDELLFSHTAW